MTCIGDNLPCHWDGRLGYCCSQFCDQNEGQEFGTCRVQNTQPSTFLPSSSASAASTSFSGSGATAFSSSSTAVAGCLRHGDRCKSDGSLGNCCSFMCEQIQGQEFGTCRGNDPPTNIPPGCLKIGDRCEKYGKLGLCCSGLCHTFEPHTEGECIANPTTTIPIPTPKGNGDGFYSWTIATSIVVPVVALIGLALFLLYRRQKRLELALSKSETDVFFYGNPEGVLSSGYAHENADCYPYDKEKWEIRESDFSIDWESPLGAGMYGLVLKGKIRGHEVAVKTLKMNVLGGGSHLRALLSEIKVLQYIGTHDYIVNMMGSNTSDLGNGKVFLFLEYCPLGSLEKYLREKKSRFNPDAFPKKEINENSYVNTIGDIMLYGKDDHDLTTSHLLSYCIQITTAMKYLEMKKVIHADIAARNVLLVRRDCAKLTDFGLSRRLYEYSTYVKKHQEPLPWRHMAPEALKQLSFSHKSDVWSLGITFWEIFSFGDVPYPGLVWTPQFIPCLESNLRPARPEMASDEMYAIMLDCWQADPEERLKFEEVHKRLVEYKQSREKIIEPVYNHN